MLREASAEFKELDAATNEELEEGMTKNHLLALQKAAEVMGIDEW